MQDSIPPHTCRRHLNILSLVFLRLVANHSAFVLSLAPTNEGSIKAAWSQIFSITKYL